MSRLLCGVGRVSVFLSRYTCVSFQAFWDYNSVTNSCRNWRGDAITIHHAIWNRTYRYQLKASSMFPLYLCTSQSYILQSPLFLRHLSLTFSSIMASRVDPPLPFWRCSVPSCDAVYNINYTKTCHRCNVPMDQTPEGRIVLSLDAGPGAGKKPSCPTKFG
jgi:hypothetical protein